jgi:hypothetical protein
MSTYKIHGPLILCDLANVSKPNFFPKSFPSVCQIDFKDAQKASSWPTQGLLAVPIRTLVPKFFLTDWPASEARD